MRTIRGLAGRAPRQRINQAIHNVSRGGAPMCASTRAVLIATFLDHNREM
ncbi:MAG TPA: hypothetical protein VGA09_21495 [Candidatus Binatia bacterium]